MSITDPSYDIQQSIVAALKGSTDLSAIVGVQVFDRIDPAKKPPYVNVSGASFVPELGESTDAGQSYIEVHGWSEKPGFSEVYKIGAAVISALHDAELVVGGRPVQSILLETARYLRDPDGVTSHGVFSFNILTDTNS